MNGTSTTCSLQLPVATVIDDRSQAQGKVTILRVYLKNAPLNKFSHFHQTSECGEFARDHIHKLDLEYNAQHISTPRSHNCYTIIMVAIIMRFVVYFRLALKKAVFARLDSSLGFIPSCPCQTSLAAEQSECWATHRRSRW